VGAKLKKKNRGKTKKIKNLGKIPPSYKVTPPLFVVLFVDKMSKLLIISLPIFSLTTYAGAKLR
jgi:hypothetical protein